MDKNNSKKMIGHLAWMCVCGKNVCVCVSSSSWAPVGHSFVDNCVPLRTQALSSVLEEDRRVPSQNEKALRPPAAKHNDQWKEQS